MKQHYLEQIILLILLKIGKINIYTYSITFNSYNIIKLIHHFLVSNQTHLQIECIDGH